MKKAIWFFDAVDRFTEVMVLRIMPLVLKVLVGWMVFRWCGDLLGGFVVWFPK